MAVGMGGTSGWKSGGQTGFGTMYQEHGKTGEMPTGEPSGDVIYWAYECLRNTFGITNKMPPPASGPWDPGQEWQRVSRATSHLHRRRGAVGWKEQSREERRSFIRGYEQCTAKCYENPQRSEYAAMVFADEPGSGHGQVCVDGNTMGFAHCRDNCVAMELFYKKLWMNRQYDPESSHWPIQYHLAKNYPEQLAWPLKQHI